MLTKPSGGCRLFSTADGEQPASGETKHEKRAVGKSGKRPWILKKWKTVKNSGVW